MLSLKFSFNGEKFVFLKHYLCDKLKPLSLFVFFICQKSVKLSLLMQLNIE